MNPAEKKLLAVFRQLDPRSLFPNPNILPGLKKKA